MGMMINRRRAMGGGITSTVNRYVQSGLVQMYDGIENVGLGVHDNNSTIWKDLIGDRDFILANDASFGSNCLITDPQYRQAAYYDTSKILDRAQHITQEVVFKADSADNSISRIIIVSFGQTAKHSFYMMNQRLICYEPAPSFHKYDYKLKSGACIHVDMLTPLFPLTAQHISVCYPTSDEPADGPTGITAKLNGVNVGISGAQGIAGAGITISGTPNRVDGFYGKVYAIRVYNRQLTDAELLNNFNVDKLRFGLTF